MGGVQGAIGTHAEAVYSQMTEDVQNALPLVFAALINVDERGTATRRRAPLDSLYQTDAAQKLVDTLIKNRLLVAFTETSNENENLVSPRPLGEGSGVRAFVEVAHEALLRTWTRLVAWIDTAKDDLQLRDAVTTAAQKWVDMGKPEYLLWKHEQLAPVYAMQERRNFAFDATVQEFIIPEAERLLEKFSADETEHRRLTIIDRWGEIGEAAVMQMVEVVKYANALGYRSKTMDLLCKILKPFNILVIPHIINILGDETSATRRYAADVLGNLGDISAVPALIVALQDEDKYVRRHAAEALSNLGDISAVPALIVALQDEDKGVRQNAAIALGKIANNSAVPALIVALQDEDKYVRRNAAEALGKIANNSAVPALIVALQDEDKGVRQNAAIALGKLDESSAIPALITALQDKSVRLYAAVALGKLGDSSAIPELVANLENPIWWIHLDVALALGKLNTKEAIAALQQSATIVSDIKPRLELSWYSAEDKQELITLLEKIGTPEALAALAEWRAKQGETGGGNT
jgi:HEAT repeat protein